VSDLDETQQTRIIEKAYERKDAKDITEKELLEWLHGNGLTSEEADKVINLAVKQRRIRFCYVSSVELGNHVRCYEKLTDEDLEFDEEIRRRMVSKSVQKDRKMKNVKITSRKKNISQKKLRA
jgi:hypothetical protein